jgi:Methyltransferase domain
MSMRQYASRAAQAVGASLRRPPFVPDGHFYSPIPSIRDVDRAIQRREPTIIPGVDLREDAQRQLWDELVPLLPELPAPGDATWRYRSGNGMYGGPDATLHAAMLRRFTPKKIVEVGSGYTTALALDIADRHVLNFELTCVEPYPQRLRSLLRPGDDARLTLIESPVQDVPDSVFAELGAGDLLFIDSTHVSKARSDVNRLFLEIIPSLAPGVDVHVRDIFWPFEYPAEWLRGVLAYTELYLLQAFLAFNSRWETQLVGSWLWHNHPGARARLDAAQVFLDAASQGEPGSIWIRQRITP